MHLHKNALGLQFDPWKDSKPSNVVLGAAGGGADQNSGSSGSEAGRGRGKGGLGAHRRSSGVQRWGGSVGGELARWSRTTASAGAPIPAKERCVLINKR
jgi:hypothetical protein